MSLSSVEELRAQYQDNAFSEPHLEFLKDKTAGNVVADKPPAVMMSGTSTCQEVLDVMRTHNFTSMPITKSDGSVEGILNLNDIATAVAFQSTFNQFTAPADLQDLEAEDFDALIKTEIMETTASELLGVSEESKSTWSYGEDYPLLKIIEYMTMGVHRLLIDTESGPKVLSQSDVLAYLTMHSKELGPMLFEQVNRLGLVSSQPEVEVMQMDESALSGFQRLYASGRMLNAIPIVDSAGSVVATLSNSDLRGLQVSQLKFLLLPVLQFLSIMNRGGKYTIGTRPAAPLREVMEKMAYARAHRVWVTDMIEQREGTAYPPISVISLTDVLCKFSVYDHKVPSA